MDLLILGILFMVMVGAGWTIYGYLMGIVPKLGFDVNAFLFICTSVEFLLSFAAAICGGIPDVSPAGWAIGYGLLVLCGIGNYFQLKFIAAAMQNGPCGIVWTIAQSGFIFPFAVGVFCFNVPLELFRGIGFCLIIISLIMFGCCGDNEASGKWKLWTGGAFFATGISQVLSNLPSYYPVAGGIGAMWRTSAFALGLGIGAILVRCNDLKAMYIDVASLFSKPNIWWLIAFGSLSNLLFSFFFLYPGMNILVKAGAGAIAYPIMVCSCLIIFELYSIIFLKEKRSVVQVAALVLCLVGSVGLCLE